MKQLPQLVLLACCLMTACAAMSGKKTGGPVVVHFSLYSYPVFTNSFDEVCPVTNEKRLTRLMAGKQYLDVKLDISKGLPVSSFSKQVKKDAELVTTLRSNHTTYVWDDLYLDFLPHNFFNRVGWIDWYLVRRDQSGKLILLQGERRWGSFGHFNLLRSAKPGDQIIGGWGC